MFKRYIFVIVAVFAIVTTEAKAPEKDAVYKLISESYTLNTDGSTDVRIRKELQIFTRMTFDHFGETFITYNPDFQELKINEAYTLLKDGTKVETPANAFNPMLSDGCTRCERLNGIRTMVVTHTGLEYDATIVLDYTIHSKNFFFQDLLEHIDLQKEVPVEKYVVTVSTPEYKRPSSLVSGKDLHYTQSDFFKDDLFHFVWTFTDLKAQPTDDYLYWNASAYMTFNTMEGAEKLTGKISVENAFAKMDNQQVVAFFQNRLSAEMSDMDKVLSVRDYIARNIHTNHLNVKTLNYIIASPNEVWNSNCGLTIEKDNLLAQVLQALGYEARLVFPTQSLAGDLQSMVYVKVGGNYYYISTGNPDDMSLDALSSDLTVIDLDGKIWEVENIGIKVDVAADIAFEEGQLDRPKVTVKRQNVQSPMTRTLYPQEISVAKAYVTQVSDKYYEMTIDDGNYGTSIRSLNIHNDRAYDVKTDGSEESYTYTVTLPANARCLTKPMHKDITVDKAHLLMDVKVDGQTVTITRQLTLPFDFIPAKSAKAFKALMGEWDAPMKLMFAK